ncbi:MAG: hypothetical protein WBG42_14985 [Cryomorphaceae bacterium]
MKNLMEKNSGITNNKARITKSQLLSGLSNFFNNYRSNWQGGGLDYNEFKINYSNGLPAIFTMDGVTNYPGLNFHYGFIKANKSICYLISYGKFDTAGNLISVPYQNTSGSDFYYMLSNDSTRHEEITPATFQTLTTDYFNHVTKKNSLGGYDPISADPIDNPKLVFHEKAELVAFDKEYKGLSDPYLYVYHVATFFPRHALALGFGSDSIPFPLDNEDYSVFGDDVRYRMKAFNIGQLCPPGCVLTTPPSTPTSQA